MRRSFSDLLKIFDDEVSQNRPNMIDNLVKVCNEGCDLKRFMGEPVCKKCAAEPSIMSRVVPPEGIASRPKTRPPGKTWSEEKLVWTPNLHGVTRNPRRFGFTEQDVATKKFYKLKGSQPGNVSFRLGEDMNPYITHDNYKNLSAEEREKWVKVSSMKALLAKERWLSSEHGKLIQAEYLAQQRISGARQRQTKVSAAKRQAKATAQEIPLAGHRLSAEKRSMRYQYALSVPEVKERMKKQDSISHRIRRQKEKAKALAGEKSILHDSCPGALQKHCEKIKNKDAKICRGCYDRERQRLGQ